MKTLKALAVIILLAILTTIGIVIHYGQGPKTLGDSGLPNVFNSATNASAAVSAATTTKILSANPGRQYAVLCNDGANKVYLAYGTAAATTSGAVVAANTCFNVPSAGGMFTGQINGIASSSTSTILTIEK